MSRLSDLRPWGMVMMISSISPGAAAPIDEIREILRQQALVPPSEAQLRALESHHLAAGLRALDPEARYIPAGKKGGTLANRAAMSGIGAELLPQEDGIWLLPFQSGPLAHAGLSERVRLLAINGQTIAGWDLEDIAEHLRGPPGTKVKLDLQDIQGRLRRLEIERGQFRPLDVELIQPGGQPVLRIRAFAAGLTRPALLATLDFLPRLREPQTPLILDLRDSIGGDLYEALDIAALFLPEGALLATLVERGGEGISLRAPRGRHIDHPLLLLIGPQTASAAEVLAGILRDYDRALLVGQRTYGKCTSQTEFSLSDGSVLRLTNRIVQLPSGVSCHGVGIDPDLMVDAKTLVDLDRLVPQALAALRSRQWANGPAARIGRSQQTGR